jgi:hypothetical protein
VPSQNLGVERDMNFDASELGLEFMEQEAEDHLTDREVLLLGLEAGSDSKQSGMDDARESAISR